MKFFQRYWPCILIAVFALYIIINSASDAKAYKDTIQSHNDSIATLNRLNAVLELKLQASSELYEESEQKISVYSDSIKALKKKNKADKIAYEKEIADIITIPADSLYLLVSDRLN
jgi:hypothetical protein